MYHIIVDITGEEVHTGDIACLDVNPLYVAQWIRRQYR